MKKRTFGSEISSDVARTGRTRASKRACLLVAAAFCVMAMCSVQADTFVSVSIRANPGQVSYFTITDPGFRNFKNFTVTGSYHETIRLEDHFSAFVMLYSRFSIGPSYSDQFPPNSLKNITPGETTSWSVARLGYDSQLALDVGQAPDIISYLPEVNKGFVERVWGPVALANGAETFEKNLLSVQGVRTVNYSLVYDSSKATLRTDGIATGWANSVESWVVDGGNGSVTVVIPAAGNIRFQESSGSYTCLTPSLRNTVLTRTVDGGWSVTYAKTRQFIYDSAGKLRADKDSAGNEISYSYTDGKLTELRDVATGKWLRMTYAAGALQTVYDATGRTITLAYQGTFLTSIQDARGVTNSFVYNAFGHMTELRGNSGELLTKNVYDTAGRVISQTDARGNTGYIAYHCCPK